MKKNDLKRFVSIALVIFALFTAVTGIWNFFPPFRDSFSPGHAFGACILCVIWIIHIWLNWKSLKHYFRGLGWWWILVLLCFILIISMILIPFFV